MYVQHEKYLPTEVTISMGNERLGALSEVVFHIEEGSFYNCVMPGKYITHKHARKYHIEENKYQKKIYSFKIVLFLYLSIL